MIHTETVDLLKPIICEGKRYKAGIQPIPIYLAHYLVRHRLAIYPKKNYTPKQSKY